MATVEENCHVCRKKLATETTLSCSSCVKGFCATCLVPELSSLTTPALKKTIGICGNNAAISFTCTYCRRKAPETTDDRLSALERQISDLAIGLNAKMKDLANSTAKVVVGGDGPERMDKTKSLAEIIKTGIRKEMTECLQEENHKKTVVVDGVPEPKLGPHIRESEFEQDKTFVTDMLIKLGLPGLEPNIHRLSKGKFVPDKVPRKLKLEFQSHLQQQMVLEAKSKLRYEDDFKKVFLRESLPFQERKAELLLRKQAAQLNEDQNGEDFRDTWDEVIIKYGIRTIKGVGTIVKFVRASPEEDWPKKGEIVDAEFIPVIQLN